MQRAVERLTGVTGGEPDIAWPTLASTDLGDRLAHAQALVRWRRSIDWQRARLLALFQSRGWYVARGHASFGDWLDRRTGLAPREAAALMRTTEHVKDLKEIDEAWRSGVMTSYQADRVSRVSSPETAEDWAGTACGERRMARCEADEGERLRRTPWYVAGSETRSPTTQMAVRRPRLRG